MSSDDGPTTPDEMRILASLDDLLLDAQEDQIQAAWLEVIGTLDEAKTRYLRGEMSEAERRGWQWMLDVTTPGLEELLRKNREIIERNRETK